MIKQKRWLIPLVMAIVILCAAVWGYFLSLPQANELPESLRISVSGNEVIASDGIDTNSSFSVTGGFYMKEDQLRSILNIEPSVNYKLSGKGKRWLITPETPLLENTIYTMHIKNADNSDAQSFAFQTRSDLLVGQSFPTDKEAYVPTNTGIELNFNTQDVDISTEFEIKPSVSGKFETNGYTSIFKPDSPLENDSIYRVTLKSGTVAADGRVLREDFSFSFETQPSDSEKEPQISLTGDFARTFLPGESMSVGVFARNEVASELFNITIHKFPGMNAYAKELRSYEAYYQTRYGQKTDYKVQTDSLDEILNTDSALIPSAVSNSYYSIPLPDSLSEGQYVITVSKKDSSITFQQIIQVANISIYTQSIDGDTLVWLNDPVTGAAIAGAGITLEDVKTGTTLTATTTEDGTARVITKDFENAYLNVIREGTAVSFTKEPLSTQEDIPLSEGFYTAIYTDREVYQPDDTIRFWGVVSPRRPTASMPKQIYAVLGASWPRGEVYRVKADVAADGTFSASMKLSGVKKDWYDFAITDGEEETYISKGVSVEAYVKPAYSIEVSTDKTECFYNEPITFSISAKYFDGTPAAGTDLNLSAYGVNFAGAVDETILRLDASGNAKVTGIPYREANKSEKSKLDWTPQSIWYQVSSVQSNDVYVNQSGIFTALPSKTALKLVSETPSGFTLESAVLDVNKLKVAPEAHPLMLPQPSLYDTLAGAYTDVNVNVDIYTAEFTKTAIGSHYDAINKRNVIEYKTVRSDSLVNTLKLKTTGGKVSVKDLPYQNTDDVFYWFEARFDGGVAGEVSEITYPMRKTDPTNDRQLYTFVDPNSSEVSKSVALNETFEIGLYKNGVKIPNKGRILATANQRKTVTAGVFGTDTLKVQMTAEYLPNINFAGAYFDGRHVYTIQECSFTYNYSDKELNLELQSDKPSYAPGETAKITLKVTNAAGEPVAASACLGVVDEAIFALAEQDLDIANQLYGTIYSVPLSQNTSYNLETPFTNPETGGMDMAMAAGGSSQATIRKNFLDTAIFMPCSTDETGTTVVEVKLPDNVTSWRFTAAAVTSDLLGGAKATAISAKLPFYITPVVTDTYIEGDDIAFSSDVVGTKVTIGSPVSYTAFLTDSTGHETDRLKLNGKAGERVYFNFGKQKIGDYKITIEAKDSKNIDRIEKTFSVLKSGIVIPVVKSMPIEDVSKLVSVRYPVTLSIYDERSKPFMEALVMLSGQSGERTERAAASYRARVTYNLLLEEDMRTTVYKDEQLENLQADDGGVKMLPIGGSDPAVTAKILMSAPELINMDSAVIYLQSVLKNAAATPDAKIMAYVGLAAAKQPVLLDITRILEEQKSALTTAQKLYLGAALAELGDQATALTLYEDISGNIVTEGKNKYFNSADNTEEGRIQTSAAALMLTSVIAHKDADYIASYLTSYANSIKSDIVPYNLELLCYTEHFQVPTNENAGHFSYIDVNNEKQDVRLKPDIQKSMSLSADALKKSAFKTVSGKIYATVSYTSYPNDTKPSSKNKMMKVQKTYTPLGGGDIKTAGRILVNVKITFDPNAPAGCYNITDRIPSGMRYVPGDYFDSTNSDTYGSFVNNEGQMVYGTLYRGLSAESEIQSSEPTQQISNTQNLNSSEMPNTYVFGYYVSASIAGNFATESAYVSSADANIISTSEKGVLMVK